MPGAGKPGAEGNAEKKLTEREYWQLVDYVLALPYFNEHGKLPLIDGSSPHGPATAEPLPGHAQTAPVPTTPAAPGE